MRTGVSSTERDLMAAYPAPLCLCVSPELREGHAAVRGIPRVDAIQPAVGPPRGPVAIPGVPGAVGLAAPHEAARSRSLSPASMLQAQGWGASSASLSDQNTVFFDQNTF